MANHKHLTLQDRYEIEHSLKTQDSFKEIGRRLDKDCTTISKEVRSHNTVAETGSFSKPFNPCVFRYSTKCKYSGICGLNDQNHHKIVPYRKCFLHCPGFVEERCPRLEKPPYVCNGCEGRSRCALRKHLYDVRKANQESSAIRRESRQGIALTLDELERVDNIVSPLVKKGQSIHHICVNNADRIMLDEKTIYNYIDTDPGKSKGRSSWTKSAT